MAALVGAGRRGARAQACDCEGGRRSSAGCGAREEALWGGCRSSPDDVAEGQHLVDQHAAASIRRQWTVFALGRIGVVGYPSYCWTPIVRNLA